MLVLMVPLGLRSLKEETLSLTVEHCLLRLGVKERLGLFELTSKIA